MLQIAFQGVGVAEQKMAARLALVSEEQAGQRLDNYLLRVLKGVPRTHVYRLLRTGQVRVNKGRAKPHYRLQPGDAVRLPPVSMAPAASSRVDPGHSHVGELIAAVIYEDDQLLILNKPAGMAVHGGSGLSYGVIEALRAARPDVPYLELVHRLDRDTSGCLLVAKRRSMLRSLHKLLREGRVEKRYLALLSGIIKEDTLKIAASLRKNRLQGGERMVAIDAMRGKQSLSQFLVLRRYRDATLTEVSISTGRTHQIRVHAKHSGHPVAGDSKYGDREANRRFRDVGLRRMFLHACRLGFVHPVSGEQVSISAPLDERLEGVLNALVKA